MVWDIHARRSDRHDHTVIHVKAKWTALGSIQDVSLEGGSGLRAITTTGADRREMNAFSRPVEADFRWDESESPEVVLIWSDLGELCQERIPVDLSGHHVLPSGLRRFIQGGSEATA